VKYAKKIDGFHAFDIIYYQYPQEEAAAQSQSSNLHFGFGAYFFSV
jgi:hypothetical protein